VHIWAFFILDRFYTHPLN